MPTQNEVAERILGTKQAAQDTIRREYLADLHEYTKRDTIVYASAFTSKKLPKIPGFMISITPEDIQSFMSALHGLKGDALDLIIHSPGGALEAADQIVQYLRAKYNHIRVIVPQAAMSAATMIACAADEIVMGKHSALGPIDPQITFPAAHGHFTAPAQAILDEFEQAKKEVTANPKTAPLWVGKVQAYPQGFLTICQNTIDLSIEKVTEWLNDYMFKDAAEKPGSRIATWLGTASEHKTHGRPIGVAKAEELGLKIVRLESDQKLQEKVLSVFHAVTVTLDITDCMKLVENHEGRGRFLNVNVQIGQGPPIPPPNKR